MADFRDVPRPNYERDVQRLVRVYERALRDIQAELNSLFLTDFERAQILAVEANIKSILSDLRKYGNAWTSETMTKVAREGVASTIYSLGLADTFEEALKIARFNGVNRTLVDAIIADTQADLLAVTQNVERRTRAVVRQVAADVMRAKAASGINGVQSIQQALTRELRNKLGSAADSAIRDSAGRQWRLKTYTEMLARTKALEAHKEATRNEAIERGVMYGVISRHGAMDACRNYENKVIKLVREAPGNYPFIDDLPRNEIFHPNCKHVISPIRRLDRLPADIRELNGI